MSDETNKTPAKIPRATAWRLIKGFWPTLRPHSRHVWWMGAFMLLGVPLAMISPLIVRQVVDLAQEGGWSDHLKVLTLVLFGMSVLSVAFGIAVGYNSTLFRAKALRDVRVRLHARQQLLSLRYYQDRETGYLMSRQLDDVGNLGGVMASAFVAAGVDAVKAAGFLVMLFALEWRMALGGCLLVGVMFLLQYFVSQPLRRRSRITRERWTAVNETLHQNISGHYLVQATASERQEGRRFRKVLHESVRAGLREDLFGLFTSHMVHLVVGVAPVLIILGGVILISRGEFTVGSLFAFFMYLGQMIGAAGEIARLNPAMQRSLASLQRINEVLDAEPEVRSPEPGRRLEALRGEVRFEEVGFAYDPSLPVLRDLSFQAPAGSVVALVGPSGAGKSTLVHLIPRFYDVTAGRILVDGLDLRDFDLSWLRQRIGVVPQEVFLFDRSIEENIAYGARAATQAAIQAAADAANATEFILETPKGFDTVIGERGVRLSGGQRQRIAIAREILRDPRILILDEATSSLDSESERLIQEALERLFVGRTSFVVAHRLSTVMRADIILVLDRGELVERGTHAELLQKRGLYHRLYETQFLRHLREPPSRQET